uniref:Uncharacterized protein n=1 Tax=Anguilla anguilla TaxID=7936 RepID=A0A0E9R560_ANGAN
MVSIYRAGYILEQFGSSTLLKGTAVPCLGIEPAASTSLTVKPQSRRTR